MPPLVDDVRSDDRLPAEVDVVVIGGGIVGVSAALELAQKGRSVALVEKGAVGAEQSGRNWGWCRQQNRDERELPLVKHSLELWGAMSKRIGAESGFRRSGLLYVTKDQEKLAEWERWVSLAREHQVHSCMLTAGEARELTPGTTERWIGGVQSPTDGRAEPSIAAPAIAKAARRLGVTIHQGCAVRSLDRSAGRVSGVVTERGRIRTATVLCAAGAWTSMFCRWHGIDLPQAGVRATAFSTTPAPEVTAGGVSTPDFALRRRLDGGYTVGVGGRGQIDLTPQGLRYARQFLPLYKVRRSMKSSIRIGRSFFEGPEALARWTPDTISPFERIRVLDPAPLRSVVRQAFAALVATYPALAGVQVACSWGGWIDHMPDAVPVISPVDALPGFFVATGFSGHGFGIGPGAGRLAADLVAGDTPVVDPAPFRYSRLVDGTKLAEPAGM